MPSGQRPLPTKREMHTNHQPYALTCREAAQFNVRSSERRRAVAVQSPRLAAVAESLAYPGRAL